MNTLVLETGLSDHHKMCITVSRAQLPKMKPNTVTYRTYKYFKKCDFKCELSNALCNQSNVGYDDFETVFMNTLNMHGPMKRKVVRANEAPFMNKEIKKVHHEKDMSKKQIFENRGK